MSNINPPTDETQAHSATTAEVQPQYLTYKQAEIYASLSRTTLWRLIGSSHIKAARIGKAVRIERKSLEDFLRRSAEEA